MRSWVDKNNKIIYQIKENDFWHRNNVQTIDKMIFFFLRENYIPHTLTRLSADISIPQKNVRYTSVYLSPDLTRLPACAIVSKTTCSNKSSCLPIIYRMCVESYSTGNYHIWGGHRIQSGSWIIIRTWGDCGRRWRGARWWYAHNGFFDCVYYV